MHELAVCQSLVDQVKQNVEQHLPCQVSKIYVKIGPLSGIEAELLMNAFSIARSGTVCEKATLQIDVQAVRIFCKNCQKEFDVSTNDLSCPECSNWQTQLISGAEMLLQSIEIDKD